MSAGPGAPVMLVLDDREQLIRRSPAAGRLHQLCDVRFLDGPLEAAEPDLSSVRFLMLVRERTALTASVLERFPQLELVLQTGGHAYHVDLEATSRRGIPVSLTRHAQAVTNAMPELTFMLAAACMRRLTEAQQLLGAGTWTVPVGRSLHGRTLGILGMGRHGRGVARLGRALGMDVVAWDRGMAAGSSEVVEDVPRVPLEALLGRADVVSIHLRLSDSSRGLLGAAELAAMKRGAVLVNTSRGPIVDEAALVEALRSGQLGAAGLDVFSEEPLPPDHPLLALDNVVLTPHVGWQVEEVFEEFAELVAGQLEAYLGDGLSRDQLADPEVIPAAEALGRLRDSSA